VDQSLPTCYTSCARGKQQHLRACAVHDFTARPCDYARRPRGRGISPWQA